MVIHSIEYSNENLNSSVIENKYGDSHNVEQEKTRNYYTILFNNLFLTHKKADETSPFF